MKSRASPSIDNRHWEIKNTKELKNKGELL